MQMNLPQKQHSSKPKSAAASQVHSRYQRHFGRPSRKKPAASSAVKMAKTQTVSKDTVCMTHLHERKNDVDEIGTFFRFLVKEVKQPKPTNAHDVRRAEFYYEWYKLGFFTDWHKS